MKPMSGAPPSTLALAVGFTFVGTLGGYFLGQASTIGVFSSSAPIKARRKSKGKGGNVDLTDKPAEHSSDSEESEGSESDESDEDDEELSSFDNDSGECKLTLVVRTDLGMTKGKMAAQCSHATLACYKTLQGSQAGQKVLKRWERWGQAKVALKADSEDQLQILQAQAMSLGVCAKIVQDAGRTQIEAGSSTVLGVGPAPKAVVDKITGSLKLL